MINLKNNYVLIQIYSLAFSEENREILIFKLYYNDTMLLFYSIYTHQVKNKSSLMDLKVFMCLYIENDYFFSSLFYFVVFVLICMCSYNKTHRETTIKINTLEKSIYFDSFHEYINMLCDQLRER